MVCSATEQGPNLQATKSTEFKGSNAPDSTTLDLRSDLVGGSADFDPVPHLGYSFVHADTNGILHQIMVINVYEETGCILLEYVHGQVECVEPVLDHKTENNQVQVQIKWDNGDITWELLSSLQKDNPVMLAKDAHNKGITNKQGGKWSSTLAKRPWNLECRFPNIQFMLSNWIATMETPEIDQLRKFNTFLIYNKEDNNLKTTPTYHYS